MGDVAVETSSTIATTVAKTDTQLQAMAARVLLTSESYAEANKLTQDEFESMALGMATTATYTQAELTTMYTSYEEMYGTASASYEQYYADLEAATQANIDALGGLFGEFNGIQEASAVDLQKWVDTKNDTMVKWKADLVKVAAMTDEQGNKIVNDGILDKLEAMGVTGAGYVAGMAEMTGAELTTFVTSLDTLFGSAADTAFEQMGEMPDVVGGIMADINSSIVNSNLGPAADSVGRSVGAGMARGINAGAGAAIGAAQGLANKVLSIMRSTLQTRSPSKITTKYGENISDGLMVGIKAKSKDAIKAASNLAKATLGALGGNSMNMSLAGSANAGYNNEKEMTVNNFNFNGPVISNNELGDFIGTVLDKRLKSYGIGDI